MRDTATNDISTAHVAEHDEQVKHNQSTHLSTTLHATVGSDIVSQPALTAGHLSNLNSVPGRTALQCCVYEELNRYFAALDGQPPGDLYQMVVSQVEAAVIDYVLDICDDNQSRAATYLGISRGKLRSRLSDQ